MLPAGLNALYPLLMASMGLDNQPIKSVLASSLTVKSVERPELALAYLRFIIVDFSALEDTM